MIIMSNKMKLTALLCSGVISVAMVGCGSSSDKNSSSDKAGTVSSKTSDSSNKASDSSEESHIGKHLSEVADILNKEKYTFECTITKGETAKPVKVQKVVSGNNIYQLQTDDIGSCGFVSLNDDMYVFDDICGVYHKVTEKPDLDIIKKIVEKNILCSKVPGEEEYDTERYSYIGTTYITTCDFYFDKNDGRLVKYKVVYSVEGNDDIIETRVVDRLDNEADETVFNENFKDELTDFDSLDYQARLDFCTELCKEKGITQENMAEMKLTDQSFGNISYDALFNLIYTYGK